MGGCAAQAPRQPDRANIGPIGKSTKCKTGHPKSWTDNCANHCCEREFNNTLRTIEDGCAAGEPIHQPVTAHTLKRVAARDGERCGDISPRGNVPHNCTHTNFRPAPHTYPEHCRTRNSP